MPSSCSYIDTHFNGFIEYLRRGGMFWCQLIKGVFTGKINVDERLLARTLTMVNNKRNIYVFDFLGYNEKVLQCLI